MQITFAENKLRMTLGGGVALVLAGGLMSGLYTLPMKFIKGWEWENTWLVYCIYGMLLLPWMFAFTLVSALWDVYARAEIATMMYTLLFGALWGVGSVTFGLAVEHVGNSLAFSIILGLATSMGAVVPMLIFHLNDVDSRSGVFTWISLGIILLGLALLGRAGSLKNRDQKAAAAPEPLHYEWRSLLIQLDKPLPPPTKSWRSGLAYCVLSGVFSAGLNIAISFGAKMGDLAQATGTDKAFADNAAWSLAVGGGFLVNFAFCAQRLFRVLSANKTWRNYALGDRKQRLKNWTLAALMGVLWMSANILYGMGGQSIGSLGKVVGWPIYLVAMVISSNIGAIVTGEWKNTGTQAKVWMAGGLLLLAAAIVVSTVGGL